MSLATGPQTAHCLLPRPRIRGCYPWRMANTTRVVLGIAIAFIACAPEQPPSAPATATTANAYGATEREPAPPTSAAPAVPSSPTEAVVQQRASLDACYVLARASNPNLGRTSIEIAFAIGTQGKPITVDLQYRHRMDDKAKECMRDAALALRFPPSMQGRQTATLTFAPPAPQ